MPEMFIITIESLSQSEASKNKFADGYYWLVADELESF